MKKTVYFLYAVAFLFTITSCEKKDVSATDENEALSLDELLVKERSYFQNLVNSSDSKALSYEVELTDAQQDELNDYFEAKVSDDNSTPAVAMQNAIPQLKSAVEYWAILERTTLNRVAQYGEQWREYPKYRFECYTGSWGNSVSHIFRIFNWHVNYNPACCCGDTPYKTMTASGYSSVSSIWEYTYDKDDPDFDIFNRPTHLYGEHYINGVGVIYTFRDVTVTTNFWGS